MKTEYATLRLSGLMASVCLLSLLVETTARAAEPATGNSATSGTGASPASNNAASPTEEIVVTSSKRKEVVQKSPAAVTAFSAKTLEVMGITSAVDLTKVVPGAQVIAENAVAQSFIRGVGSNIDNPYSDPGVGININGIALPRFASGSSFLDLERVEVLPGPQGTLYGGSASGGVINLIAAQPGHNFNGQGTLEGGNYGMVHTFVAQNAPIGDGLSLRGAFDFVHRDGYESRNLDSVDRQFSSRISALWTPSDDFKAYVFGSIFDLEGKPNATVNSPLLNPGNPWEIPTKGPLLGNPVDAANADASYKTYIIGGRFDYTFDDLTVSYIPGLVVVDVLNKDYAADFPFQNTDKETQYSNEIRLANSEADRNSWQVGLYQSHTSINYSFYFFGAPTLLAPDQTNDDYAVYFQDVYKATDWLRLTVGGRYSYDSKNLPNGFGAGGPFSADHHWVDADWKVGVDADVTKDVLVYGTIQTGYLPGGYSPLPNTQTYNNNVNPERLLSFTAGVKSRLLDNKLTLNDEAYYYIYKGFQLVAIDLATGFQTVQNAPRSVIYGDQFNAVYYVTANDALELGVNLMDATFTNLTIAGRNISGYALGNAPVATGEISYEHRFDLADEAEISFRVQSHIQAGYWGLYDHSPGTHVDGYTKTDLTLTYTPPSGSWSAGVWVKNIENTPVFQATAAGGQPGPASSFIAPPRTFGVKLSANW
jgi:iron complex outermembrane receptor protein